MVVSSRCKVAAGLLLAFLVLPGKAAFAETVKVEDGLLKGTVKDGLQIYRGIPYAAPPVGDLRWRPPEPAPKWEGGRAADEFGRACVQTNAGSQICRPRARIAST